MEFDGNTICPFRESSYIWSFAVIFRILKQETLKELGSPIWLVLLRVNLNSLKAISFKGRFPGCMGNVFYVINILEIILWFSFNVMYLGENHCNLSETKKCFLFPALSQNEKILAWYEKRHSHNEYFLSCWDSQPAKQSYYSDK